MKPARSFASDNNAGVHPEVLKAMADANHGHVVGYGDDPYTGSAVKQFERHFGPDIEVFFVFNGTAANVLSLTALTRSFHAVICTEAAHIYTDECGAPEKFTGCKLLPIAAPQGKLTIESVRSAYHGIGDQHHVQPKVVAITQATEMGTVYAAEEIRALANFAHAHDMYVHMDGARIANAAVSLGLSLRQLTQEAGVDVLSFGATKNGIMGAEAVVFFDKKLAQDFLYLRKQGMQLASKMRFMAVQFEALLSDDLWRRSACHANLMAKLLEAEVRKIPHLEVVYPVQANGVFVRMPHDAITPVQERYFFYVWNEEQSVVRWMCSFDTTEEDIRDFTTFVRQTVEKVA
ncbi:MAG TPA: low specificity L-threonine aldolase [Terriglobales bacterium]|nr:low specificity L-threonine aldolase [Terriglobales bacterium]